jgi:hypothetical protein
MNGTPVRAMLWMASVVLGFGCDAVLDAPRAKYAEIHFDAYLKSPEVHAEARFGQNIAFDETTLVVSAPFEEVESSTGETVAEAGAVYVFDLTHRDAPAVRLTTPNPDVKDGQFPDTRLPPTFLSNPIWGVASLALNDDWIAVGFPGEDGGLVPGDGVSVEEAEANNSAPDSGAVYLYRRADLSAPPLYLKAPYAQEGDLFGASLALSDGWLAVAAMGERSSDPEDSADEGAPKSGAIFMYRYDEESDEFVFQQFVKAPRIHEDDTFGSSLSLEDNLMAVGAILEDGAGAGSEGDLADTSMASKDEGAVYTFIRTNNRWNFEAYLKSPQPDLGAAFGWTVQVFGGRIAVGQPLGFRCPGDEQIALHGVAYVISRASDGDWAKFQCLDPTGREPYGLFGIAVAGHEHRLTVGAAWEPSAKKSGTVYVFEPDASGVWQQRASLVAPNKDDLDGFGAALGVNSTAIAVGAFGESSAQSGVDADPANNDAHYAGAAYLFSTQ